ncbi:hypothetical protein J1N10_15870 [Carboxylicivirga sp. A043]|uniref:hypothetical protein n=1 Tax=Carboxylicivirga litoralis TaxID=2816963 RepID=UPI0021CB8004|nr:hypothetical protein [Carboxylicivirga sp. A043]MCU4157455.1 hypothetical protein [Carboxylicivirga sp. A043]
MSGSSRGYVPTYSSDYECDKGTIVTNLASPDYTVLAQHNVGEILTISILSNNIVVENNNGEILGSVIHEHTEKLKECIAQGNIYSAKIIQLNDYTCKVKIYNSGNE